MDERRAGNDPPDEAVFAPARIARSRAPIVALGVALAIAGVAIAGSFEGLRDATSTDEQPGSTRRVDAPTIREIPPAAEGPGVATGPLLDLDARSSGGTLFVNGDVFTRNAVLVIVSIADAAEKVLEVRSLDMPGGSTAFRIGANDRFLAAFDVERLPARQVVWVTANAYDRFGMVVASARTPVPQP